MGIYRLYTFFLITSYLSGGPLSIAMNEVINVQKELGYDARRPSIKYLGFLPII